MPAVLPGLAVLVALTACSSTAGYHPPTGPAAIEGYITAWDGAQPTGVLVEEQPDEESGGRKIHFRMTAETQLLRWNDDAGGYGTIDPVDLAVGQRVRAWNRGPIAESYPEQTEAHTIVLLE